MAHKDMIEMVRPRLRGIMAQGEALAHLDHPGVKGRLREIFVQDMISPFLPPSVIVRTGTIVSLNGDRKQRNQDDVVLFSKERAPLLMDHHEQAVIPIEGVLAHIEVKSVLKKADLKNAVQAAVELRDMAVKQAPIEQAPIEQAPVAIVFAYRSDMTNGSELDRLLDVLRETNFSVTPGQASCPVQMLCVATRGTWLLTKIGDREGWWFAPTEEERHLLTFASVVSNSIYKAQSGKHGVGDYLLDEKRLQGPSPECPVLVPYDG